MGKINRRGFLVGSVGAAALTLAGCGQESPVIGLARADAVPPKVFTVAPPVRIRYGATSDNFGDLYLPTGEAGNLPVVVMIHGGGWAQNHTLGYTSSLARTLVPHGIAVWNIEYRRVGGLGGWPVTLSDAADAVEALPVLVQQYANGRLDLERVHVAGHSAGGQLAAWLISRPKMGAAAPGGLARQRLRSATVMAGVFDMRMAAELGHDHFVPRLLGGTPQQVPDRYHLSSPIDFLPIGLPVTAIHGDKDTTVSPDQSRLYVSAAKYMGDPAWLKMLPGVGHMDFGDPRSTAWAVAKESILGYVGG